MKTGSTKLVKHDCYVASISGRTHALERTLTDLPKLNNPGKEDNLLLVTDSPEREDNRADEAKSLDSRQGGSKLVSLDTASVYKGTR
mmetsp:Transcript_16112/g.21085  ORF Transcript_16112/g.21085 Transcript_16112/m.21085 type:complete len:87 (+) Transcript_16112:549-809(+)|eukprot:CAMPEP_0197288174 /NCGR_PEP_ID=MMETSP0890-20130614/5157_1 /TAXON_ID=44058 ORGANISM="Aureoumbra lagunensis, Strain CCMP1510" /NCGR_SAMPLE_ID=MMETSP0890 /ASSEMBLY_ACC=CAM_ASM_000533 /LENGTH=86 /DNA_ID=CAMNT_0042758677 /DNA_START=386 /DNA_END=646 /DNA_ORIENTATION=+